MYMCADILSHGY